MALVLKDRVQETTTTSGTGTLTLLGAVSGFDTFSASIGNGNITYYTIFDNTAYVWEVGIGTVGAGTLARTTVLSNSSGTTTPISLAGNVAFVFCTYPAEKSINYDADGVATIGQTLGYADTGIVGSFASTVAGYNQVIVQNKSTATNASSNLNVSNDAGTSGSNYAELGINSSTFTGTGSFNIAGASYVASASTDLTLGTYGAYNVHFVTNSSTTDAMTIYNNGGISLGAFGNPGIGNMAASKFVPGYTAITSAAGTTVLTADSNYYQNLLGSTTQTYQLPDATTLLVGTTFIFDNDSSGTLTVVDNASGPIETVPGGAASFVYLAVNSTVAGTWRRHAFLPASYDFNATTANFGSATITNATWNGNTIGTAYGGTGLTSFSAANYALYSTSSSALTAGTLPVAAGGSGAVTFTANGVLYGDGTNPLSATAAGTTGQVLVGNTGGAPSWSTISSSLVSSFQTSLSGLTPSTATTGAVTLAGTLGPTSGGTGASTAFTTGSIIFAGTGGTYSQNNANFFWDDTNNRLGIGTTAPATKLTISANTALPSAGAAGANTLWLVGADATANNVTIDAFGSNGAYVFRRAQGTAASPTALASGNLILFLGARGYGATGYSANSRATIQMLAAEAWTDTAQGTYTIFTTTQIGTTTSTEKMRILDSGAISFGSSGTDYGTSGQVLTSAGNATPTWTSLSSSAVTSFQTSLSGLTPSTATTGAVTLAGTLGPTSGGTGLTSYTTGDIIYASATNTLSKLADVATGNALISGGVSTAPSWGKIGLTTHVSGTLPVASGGTGTSTAFTTGSVVFAGASGTYTQDNANFFWDDTNNRLGIGTASPTAKLAITAANLGTTAGSQSLYQALNSNDGNNDVLEISNTRQIAGSFWNGAGSRLQQKIDTTYMGYIQFNGGSGTTNDAGISFGTGTNASATGVTERMRITSTGAIQDGSGNPLLISGKETIWVPAFAMTPRVTNGPASILTQLGTNGTLITSLSFDTATTEYAQFQIRMPKSWNQSTVTFTPVWTANSTSTASVAWVLRAKALGNAETIDAAWGTGVTVVDPNTATAYQAHIPAESSAVTIANASALEWVVFEIYRDVANVSDTLAADALLLGVTINYTTNAANDA